MNPEPPRFPYREDHATAEVILKFAKIDTQMIPLIKWMNSFDSVFTLYCCEGTPTAAWNDKAPESDRPHVSWLCWDAADLVGILRWFPEYTSPTTVFWDSMKNQIMYRTEFHNQAEMLDIIDRLVLKGLIKDENKVNKG